MYKYLFGLLVVLCSSHFSVLAQEEGFKFERPIEQATADWHAINIPDDMFEHIKVDGSDIRMYGIKGEDTIVIPYMIKTKPNSWTSESIPFKQINTSKNNEGYYYTFEIPSKAALNTMQLQFNKQNFDWQVKLEGSNDQREWFTVLKDYRLLSINNEWSNYSFTKLVFPSAKYRYFRLKVDSAFDPELTSNVIAQKGYVEGNYKKHAIKAVQIKEQKENKQSQITFHLNQKVPVSNLSLTFDETIDFYRNVHIEYLVDSVKTERGFYHNYSRLTSGVLSSFEKNDFNFKTVFTNQIRLTIDNQDNAALKFESATVNGLIYKIVARFDAKEKAKMYYGNPVLNRPQYDIVQFAEEIPENPPLLSLGTPVQLQMDDNEEETSATSHQYGLWAIMLVIVALLVWSSLKMLKKVEV